jgi:hypothetical protein
LPLLPESKSRQNIDEVGPAHRVKSLGDIKLEEQPRGLLRVQLFDEVLDIKKIIMNAPLLDESTLAIGDKVWKKRSKAVSQKLGPNLG